MINIERILKTIIKNKKQKKRLFKIIKKRVLKIRNKKKIIQIFNTLRIFYRILKLL